MREFFSKIFNSKPKIQFSENFKMLKFMIVGEIAFERKIIGTVFDIDKGRFFSDNERQKIKQVNTNYAGIDHLRKELQEELQCKLLLTKGFPQIKPEQEVSLYFRHSDSQGTCLNSCKQRTIAKTTYDSLKMESVKFKLFQLRDVTCSCKSEENNDDTTKWMDNVKKNCSNDNIDRFENGRIYCSLFQSMFSTEIIITNNNFPDSS